MAQIRYLFADCEEALQRGGLLSSGYSITRLHFTAKQAFCGTRSALLTAAEFQSKNAYLQAEFPTIKQEQLAVYL